jgi:hypothetical protein
MSLNFNLRKCADHEALTADDQWPTTEIMIMMTMAVDIGDLRNEAMAKEFFLRCQFYEKVVGPFLPGRKAITLDEVKRYIGLNTNVSYMRRPSWIKRMTDNFFHEKTFEMNREAAKAASGN